MELMYTKMTDAERRERARFCLERVGLKGADDKYPSEISGGSPYLSSAISAH